MNNPKSIPMTALNWLGIAILFLTGLTGCFFWMNVLMGGESRLELDMPKWVGDVDVRVTMTGPFLLLGEKEVPVE